MSDRGSFNGRRAATTRDRITLAASTSIRGPSDRWRVVGAEVLELAPRDPEIRSLVFEMLADPASPHTADSLGRRLLERAGGPLPLPVDHQEAP